MDDATAAHGPTEPSLMMVHDGWKFMCPNKPDSTVMNALFNPQEHPYEMTNLLGQNPGWIGHKGKAEALKARLVAWLEAVDSPHVEEVKRRNSG